MERFARLIVGVEVLDYGRAISQGSQAAIRQATWLAKLNGASITLLYSHYKRPSSPMFERQAIEDLARSMRRDDLRVELIVAEERPSDEIVARVQAGEADMIFVGKRNRLEGAATPLGNVARKLMRISPVPVWAVDPYHSRELKSIVIAHDLLEVGSNAARLAAEMSVLAEVPLHVIHAWKVPMALQMSEGRISEERYRTEETGLAEAALHGMQQDLAGVPTHGPAVFHEGCGPASSVILDKTVEIEASLLVMGTLARSGIAGLFVGNTAEKILDRAPCSLLTVKPQDFEVPLEDERRHTTQMMPTVGIDPDPDTSAAPAAPEAPDAPTPTTGPAASAEADSPKTDTTDSDQ